MSNLQTIIDSRQQGFQNLMGGIQNIKNVFKKRKIDSLFKDFANYPKTAQGIQTFHKNHPELTMDELNLFIKSVSAFEKYRNEQDPMVTVTGKNPDGSTYVKNTRRSQIENKEIITELPGFTNRISQEGNVISTPDYTEGQPTPVPPGVVPDNVYNAQQNRIATARQNDLNRQQTASQNDLNRQNQKEIADLRVGAAAEAAQKKEIAAAKKQMIDTYNFVNKQLFPHEESMQINQYFLDSLEKGTGNQDIMESMLDKLEKMAQGLNSNKAKHAKQQLERFTKITGNQLKKSLVGDNQLTPDIAADYLKRFGNNRLQAEEAAKADGYIW